MHRFQICCASIDASNRAYVCSSTGGALEASLIKKELRGWSLKVVQVCAGSSRMAWKPSLSVDVLHCRQATAGDMLAHVNGCRHQIFSVEGQAAGGQIFSCQSRINGGAQLLQSTTSINHPWTS